ncbi:hypothetical protein EXIGLDRAFT_758621 [Exidia glandulosa HHB12029]|uniref:Uncharacterized protein n=1 Tax=Exidia glandulosa HHB12029 TaxID=1314781 RepID=A0A165R0N6_EXIGL|nr:hypothetical protein EXIGLDRAFT_758621 [Exidia glandulosa HHB12029]
MSTPPTLAPSALSSSRGTKRTSHAVGHDENAPPTEYGPDRKKSRTEQRAPAAAPLPVPQTVEFPLNIRHQVTLSEEQRHILQLVGQGESVSLQSGTRSPHAAAPSYFFSSTPPAGERRDASHDIPFDVALARGGATLLNPSSAHNPTRKTATSKSRAIRSTSLQRWHSASTLDLEPPSNQVNRAGPSNAVEVSVAVISPFPLPLPVKDSSSRAKHIAPAFPRLPALSSDPPPPRDPATLCPVRDEDLPTPMTQIAAGMPLAAATPKAFALPSPTTSLIMQDSRKPREAALKIMRNSSRYGTMMFRDDNDDDANGAGDDDANGAGDSLMRALARARRKQLEQDEAACADAANPFYSSTHSRSTSLSGEPSRANSHTPEPHSLSLSLPIRAHQIHAPGF